MPSHSAILCGYQSRSIHADHMQMARFKNAQDPGYISVSDQLWFWVEQLRNSLEMVSKAEVELQPSAEEIRGRRNKKFHSLQGGVSEANFYAPVHSEGGQVLQGNPIVGRDFNVGGNRR